MKYRSIFLVIAVLVSAVASANVYLTPNVETCPSSTCRFEDTSLWSTGAVPAENDTVYLDSTQVNVTSLAFTIESKVNVHAIFIAKVNVTVMPSSYLNASTVSVDNAVVDIHGNITTENLHVLSSQLSVNGFGALPSTDGVFFVDANSEFILTGEFITGANSTFAGVVTTSAQSTLMGGSVILGSPSSQFLSRPLFNDLWLVEGNAYTFASGIDVMNKINVPSGTILNVHTSITVSQIVLDDATATVHLNEVGYFLVNGTSTASHLGVDAVPILGEGRLHINSSSLLIFGGNEKLNCSITINGTNNNIQLNEFIFGTTGTFSVDSPSTVIHWAFHSVSFAASTQLYGDATFTGSNSVLENVDFVGDITQVVVSAGTVSVHNSTLFTTTTITVGNATLTIDDAGAISASDVFVTAAGTIGVGDTVGHREGEYAPAAIHANIWNSGTVEVTQRNLLTVWGDYVNHPNSTLHVVYDTPVHPTDANATATALWIANEVELRDSSLLVTVRARPTDSEFTILSSPSYINSTFGSARISPTADAASGEYRLEYRNSTLIVVFKPNENAGGSDFWSGPWPGVIFGVGGAVIVALIVFFVYRRYRAKKYQAIP